MQEVRCEIWRDPESRRLWALEVFGHEIIGCLGPFREQIALPPRLGQVTFERNAELLRWLRHRRQHLPHLTNVTAPAG